MAKRSGRPRGRPNGKPTDQAILAAIAASDGNVSKAALALGHNRRSVARWAAEIRDGKEKRTPSASDPPTDVDVTDPESVRQWTIRRLVAIAEESATQAAITAIDKISSLCGSTGGAGKPRPIDLELRWRFAAALRDYLGSLTGPEREVYRAASQPRATVDEVDALARIAAGCEWTIRFGPPP